MKTFKVKLFDVEIEKVAGWLQEHSLEVYCYPIEYRATIDGWALYFQNKKDYVTFKENWMNEI